MALRVVSEPELTVVADDGSLTMLLVLRDCRVLVVPVVLNMEMDPVERRSLPPWGLFVGSVVAAVKSTITFL